MSRKLNVGCGNDFRPGWINTDLHVQGPEIIRMDMRDLKIEDGSIDQIYAGQVLEHIPFREVSIPLKEFHRVLVQGGVLEVEVPDLEWVLQNWLNQPEEERWGFWLQTIFGNQIHPGEFHCCGFTLARIVALVEEAGFRVLEQKKVWSHDQQKLYVKTVKR